MTDLDLWDCFGRKKDCLITEEIWYIKSTNLINEYEWVFSFDFLETLYNFSWHCPNIGSSVALNFCHICHTTHTESKVLKIKEIMIKSEKVIHVSVNKMLITSYLIKE